MTEFEVITITLSLILGLGVAQILTGVVDLARASRPVTLDWMPLVWAWCLFAFQIQIWFAAFDISNMGQLDGGLYLIILAMAVLLYLAGGLVLPSQGRGLPGNLLDDFDKFGRRALYPLGGFLFVGIAMNLGVGLSFTHPINVFVYVLVIPLVAVLFSSRRALQRGATIVFALVQAYALLFVWSRPDGF
jgi:hypothetical protein